MNGRPELTIRPARRGDLEAIVHLLADDPLGSRREEFADPLPGAYSAAFSSLEADPNNTVLVARQGERVIGVLQLTLIPNLTYLGGWRAQIEGVRVSREVRGQGIGKALLQDAIRRAELAGCRLVQLTTDRTRPEALRFYESLGFAASHVGMKLHLM